MNDALNQIAINIVIIFGVIAVLGIILQLAIKNKTSDNKKKYDYTKAYKSVDSILTKAELNFYNVLEPICYQLNVTLFTKVRMSDLVIVTDKENARAYLNKVQSKHIDFVLCDMKTLKPLICLELDDKTHNRQDRVDRDKFIDEVLGSVGYKVLHINCGYKYDKQAITSKIQNALNQLKAS